MMLGHVRDNFPRLTLTLPGLNGPLPIEFIIDTGFDGELSLPAVLLQQCEATFSNDHPVKLADGTRRLRPYFEVLISWNQETRLAEVMVLENAPLLGVRLLNDLLVTLEMTDGGEVTLEAL